MDSPIRPPPPPPPPAADPVAPSSPPSRDGSLSPENPAPAPPPPPSPPAGPTTTPPPRSPGDSSPSSPPHPPTPPPPPPLPPSADAPPPLQREDQTSPPRSPPHPTPAPVPPPPPAPASSDAKSEQEAAESASESGSMTLALALTQTADSTPPTPPKASSARASPIGSPQKESAVTIAKLLSGKDLAAAEAKPAAEKVAPPSDNGSLAADAAVAGAGGGGGGGSVGSKRWLLSGGVPEKVRRAELRRAELGFRVSAAVFCLVALSVMAADTTTGWSGDSFRRYNEYRYVLAASVVAFTYSGFQLVAEVHYLVTRRHIIEAPWRSYFNLAMDQMLAYLLLSASSAALSRNGVWMSRFGGDQFTKLIDASASMAFLAFIALGLSSIISAYSVFSLVS
ncbi:unnamed protein product [Urochloa decumbens]|uniref:CASP-like protein n=1 Tax=Urochloa decumbens TaxID=240449 RepID=A0ABC8ZLC8_9POAL